MYMNVHRQYYLNGIPLQVFPATCRKYCKLKTISYEVVMG